MFFFLYIKIYLFVIIAITQNPQAFLRVNILSFQIHNSQSINLINVKTQVELKEQHRSARDNIESKNQMKENINRYYILYLRTSTSEISNV